MENADLYARPLRPAARFYVAARQTCPVNAAARELVTHYILLPALFSFVEWVLTEAQRQGQSRLYFLARDGYLMYHAAKRLCQKRGLPIECRYLYCSRYSLRQPLFSLDQEAALSAICRPSLQVNLDHVLARAGLTTKEKQRVAAELPTSFSLHAPLSPAALPTLRQHLLTCPSFWPAVCRRAHEARPSLRAYLAREGLLDGRPIAIVDSGWLGSVQQSLQSALRAFGCPATVHGFYFGLYRPLPLAQAYAFSARTELRTKARFNPGVFETLFSAPHGTTRGYSATGQPLLSAPTPGLSRWLERRLSAFAHALPAAFKAEQLSAERKILLHLLTRFMAHPTRQEVRCFGRLPFSDDMIEAPQPLALPLTPDEIRSLHLLARLKQRLPGRGGVPGMPAARVLRQSAWPEGSIVRLGQGTRYHLWQHRCYQYLRHVKEWIL